MNKYEILKSKNEYINYTINNYLNCYNDLNTDDINLFTVLFDQLTNHKITIGNCLVDGIPMHGVRLDSCEKHKYRDCDNFLKQLDFIAKSIDSNDRKDVLFFQSISHLCKSMSNLDNMELLYLNEIFQTVSERKQSLSNDTINNGETFFFPYNRYPQKKLK